MESYDELIEAVSISYIKKNLKNELDPFRVVLTKHFYDRAKERRISNQDFTELLNKLFSEKNKEKLKKIRSNDILVKGKNIVVPFERKAKDKLAAKTVFKNKDYETSREGQYQLNLSEFLKTAIEEKIKKVDGKWVVYPSKGGDRLGTHSNRKDALKQLAAIEISKKGKSIKEYVNNRLEEVSDKELFLKELLKKLK